MIWGLPSEYLASTIIQDSRCFVPHIKTLT
jgi:hypothetical protein